MKKINKKGFSLVELIICIAIMVALISVLAPSFYKYAQKSRNATVQQAAEETLTFVKTEFADMNLEGEGIIRITSADDKTSDLINISFYSSEDIPDWDGEKDIPLTLKFEGLYLTTKAGKENFLAAAGWHSVVSSSPLAFEIRIMNREGDATYNMQSLNEDTVYKLVETEGMDTD